MNTLKTNIILKEMNIESFIIPNHAGKISEYWFGQEQKLERVKQIYSHNEIEADPEQEHLLQLWSTNGKSDNMSAHGFYIEHNGLVYRLRMDELLPASLFKGKKEGEIVDVTLPIKPEVIYDKELDKRINFEDLEDVDPDVEFWIDFHIKLNQLSYRYKSFGNFEDVFQRVVY